MSMDTKTGGKKKLTWKLRLVMVSKGINTASELKRRLDRYGYDITTTHAARIVNMLPQRISSELFEALVNVLDCSPGDLLVIEAEVDATTNEAASAANTLRSSDKMPSYSKVRKLPSRTKVVAVDDDAEHFGPLARTLPKPVYDETPDK
jgi:DNA-binding Xre family transcriptional regulator